MFSCKRILVMIIAALIGTATTPAAAGTELTIIANKTTEIRAITAIAGGMRCSGHQQNASFVIPAGDAATCSFDAKDGVADVYFQVETKTGRCLFHTGKAGADAARFSRFSTGAGSADRCAGLALFGDSVIVN